jgi:hypothetical protein
MLDASSDGGIVRLRPMSNREISSVLATRNHLDRAVDRRGRGGVHGPRAQPDISSRARAGVCRSRAVERIYRVHVEPVASSGEGGSPLVLWCRSQPSHGNPMNAFLKPANKVPGQAGCTPRSPGHPLSQAILGRSAKVLVDDRTWSHNPKVVGSNPTPATK